MKQNYEDDVLYFWLALPFLLFCTLLAFLQHLWLWSRSIFHGAFSFQARPRNPGIFLGLSSLCSQIREKWGSHIALDIVYFAKEKIENLKNPLDRWFSAFWLLWVLKNPKAVRNRLKLVTALLHHLAMELVKKGEKSLQILSVACGSAHAVFAVAEFLQRQGVQVELTLLDLSREALEYCQKHALQRGLKVKLIQGRASQVTQLCPGNYHIIEMVGFGDYLTDAKYEAMLQKLRQLLDPKGFLIVANIAYNLEKPFMDYVVCWRMIYRTKTSFQALLARLEDMESCIFTEPQQIHMIGLLWHKTRSQPALF